MRASRLMSLLLHLQTRGHLTARDLATRLNVSERTVQRDVETLAGAGIPVRSVRGPTGGYQLDGGYRTKLTGLTAEESEALAFLGLAGPASQLGFGDSLDAARVKVLAALTGEGRDRVQRAASRFHFDPVRWYGTSEPTPRLAAVTHALWQDRRLRISYAKRGARTTDAVVRVVDPLGLVLAAGDWYLMASRDGDTRTYRVARLLDAQVLPDPGSRPAGFDLAATWARSRRELETRHELVDVTVRAEAAVLPRLRRLVAVDSQDRVDLSTPPGATIDVTVQFETDSWAVSALLGLGGSVEVLEPRRLRDRMRAETTQAAARYTRADAGLAQRSPSVHRERA